MDETAMFGPLFVPRIEEPIPALTNPVRDLPALCRVTEWTGPRIVVQVIWTTALYHRCDPGNATGGVLHPTNRRNDVVDLKSANGGEQTILTAVARAETNSQSHQRVASPMPRPSRQMLDDRLR